MKNKLILLLVSIIIGFSWAGCQSKSQDVDRMIRDVLKYEPSQLEIDEPIKVVLELAASQAEKSFSLTKSNVSEVVSEMKNYPVCLIIVGHHTLVRITDAQDCSKSTSWGCCMPQGTSLTQKDGKMVRRRDYINSIIGQPDKQSRKVFFFK